MKLLIWLLVFPLVVSSESLLHSKARKLAGRTTADEAAYGIAAILDLIVYWAMAYYFAGHP